MSKRRILVIDDDVRLSQTLKRLIEFERPFDVLVENDPLRAVQTALRWRPDVIVLDVIMPHKDGGTVAAEIREQPALADVRVVFLTSILDREEAAVRGNTLGGDPGHHGRIACPDR